MYLYSSTTLLIITLTLSTTTTTAALSSSLPQRHTPRLSGIADDNNKGEKWIPRPRSSLKKKRSSPVEVNVVTGTEFGLVHEKKNKKTARSGMKKRDPAEFGKEVAIIEGLGEEGGIYTIPISIGQPPQTFSLQLDIASSDLLLPSTLCSTTSCPSLSSDYISTLYHPSRSETFLSIKSNTTHFNLTFSDESFLSGFLAEEDVAFSIGTERLAQDFVVKGQVVGVVNGTNVDLEREGIRGLVGLGFPRLSQFARVGLGLVEGMKSEVMEGSSSAVLGTASVSASASSTATTTGEEEITFSILPIPEITPYISTAHLTATAIGASITSASNGVRKKRQATSTSSSTSSVTSTPTYYPPLLENLFNPHLNYSSSNTSHPILSYPVFSLALANNSSPFSVQNSNASIVIGGVSDRFVGREEGKGMDDIEWYEVVPFGRARGVVAEAGMEGEGVTLLDLEEEEYLYWALELANITMNGTSLDLSPTYNSSNTGTNSIALLDVGTNGIFGPQQDVVNLFYQIPSSRQVSPGQWIAPCNTKQTMTFQFKLPNGTPGRVIELQPSEWLSAQIEGSEFCLAWPVVAPPSADGVDWQLGTPVLRKMYTVFGYGISGEQGAMVGVLPLPERGSGAGGVGTASVSATSGSVTGTIGLSTTVSGTPTSTRASTDPTPTSIQAESEVRSLVTMTITTILPNVLLPNPTYTTPPYAFNTSAPVPMAGVTQTLGLANGTIYDVTAVPIVTSLIANATASGSSNPGNGNNAGSSSGSGQGGAMGKFGLDVSTILGAGLMFLGALITM